MHLGSGDLYTNLMMFMEVIAELATRVQELFDAHVRRPFAAGTGVVENVPRAAKAAMEHFHHICQSRIRSLVLTAQRRKSLSFGYVCSHHD